MILPSVPINERDRLDSLKNYSLLDTLPEKEFDEITFLASHICETPISLVTLIDENRAWFKSHYGIDEDSAPRELSFCAHAIEPLNQIMVVPDSRKDERFFDNPLVTGATNIRFYAGIPLVSSDGFPLGTLCVLDHNPKELDEKQITALQALSNQVLRLFEARKQTLLLKNQMYDLEIQNKGLNEFARVAAHDIKSPLSNIIQMTDILQSDYKTDFRNETFEILDLITKSSLKLSRLIDGILEYSKNSKLILSNKKEVNLSDTVREIISLIDPNSKAQIEINIDQSARIFTNKVAFDQILINLISNAIKYNDKKVVQVKIIHSKNGSINHLHIIDNGRGIQANDLERVFSLFETSGDSVNNGTGIGLATVKSLVEGLGGQIHVSSEPSSGSDFHVILPN